MHDTNAVFQLRLCFQLRWSYLSHAARSCQYCSKGDAASLWELAKPTLIQRSTWNFAWLTKLLEIPSAPNSVKIASGGFSAFVFFFLVCFVVDCPSKTAECCRPRNRLSGGLNFPKYIQEAKICIHPIFYSILLNSRTKRLSSKPRIAFKLLQMVEECQWTTFKKSGPPIWMLTSFTFLCKSNDRKCISSITHRPRTLITYK